MTSFHLFEVGSVSAKGRFVGGATIEFTVKRLVFYVYTFISYRARIAYIYCTVTLPCEDFLASGHKEEMFYLIFEQNAALALIYTHTYTYALWFVCSCLHMSISDFSRVAKSHLSSPLFSRVFQKEF